MTTSFPRVPINNVPTNKLTAPPTDSVRRERVWKRPAAQLQSAEPTNNTSPCIQTWAQVATVAAWVAPPALSTCSHTHQSNIPPLSRCPGFAAAMMGQQQHQRGMVQLTQRITRLVNKVHQALAVMDADTGKLLNYRQLMRSTKYKKAWSLSLANKFGWLANGIGSRKKNTTNTIEFIYQHEVPKEQKWEVTYRQFVCTVRPKKAEPNQTGLSFGGDRINYMGKVATPTTEMLVAKMLFNSVISTKGNRFMTMAISNFYLMTPLHQPEFIQMKLSNIPDKVIKEYKLRQKATPDGSIYVRAKWGMYGLPQSGLLANKLLEKRLNKHGYRQSKLVPGLWKHDTQPIQFTLVVDDFGIKYVSEEHANNLKWALDEHYKLTCDWTGTWYIGIILDWNYTNHQVQLSMPNYVTKALKQFQHIAKKCQYAPYPWSQFSMVPRKNTQCRNQKHHH
jgi:hypothetical protein